MHHELKIHIPYYEAVKSGDKNFEIRYNDRGYQKGDAVTLIPFDGKLSLESKSIEVEITYVCSFQQKDGWVVFGFKIIEQPNSKGVL